MIVYDKIEGLTGRPQSGLLATLFRLIGEGRIRQSRFAIANDGLLISRVQAKKGPFGVKATVTVYPDGTMTKSLPEGRPDLISIEQRLRRPLQIEYHEVQLNLKPGEDNDVKDRIGDKSEKTFSACFADAGRSWHNFEISSAGSGVAAEDVDYQ